MKEQYGTINSKIERFATSITKLSEQLSQQTASAGEKKETTQGEDGTTPGDETEFGDDKTPVGDEDTIVEGDKTPSGDDTTPGDENETEPGDEDDVLLAGGDIEDFRTTDLEEQHKTTKQKKKLVIGVLASFAHHDRRKAIRETWTQYLTDDERDRYVPPLISALFPLCICASRTIDYRAARLCALHINGEL